MQKENRESIGEIIPNIDYDEKVNQELEGINLSLAEQISEELSASEEMEGKKKFSWKKTLIISTATLATISSFILFLAFTPMGHSMLKKIGGKIWAISTNKFEDNVVGRDDLGNDELDDNELENFEEVKVEDVIFRNADGEGRHEDYAYNILLLGEEAMKDHGARGRTDAMIIATINTKTKSIKLTSLMRDCYVQIPGYNNNKLNSAYAKGGIELLYQTIAKNFDIRIDGSVLVNFSDFEKIIDTIGGVDIEITAVEAKYLGWSNYISNPKNRTLVPGMNHMNGNQALGYSRVRMRRAITGKADDYGRTDRHRIVLNAIFEKYKNLNQVELLTLMYKMLPMITTDISDKEFEYLLSKFLETGAKEMQQLRIPVDGAFKDNVKIGKLDPLILDFDKNIEELHKFIFGTTKNNSTSVRENSNVNAVAIP